jgi:hypothetical protein
LAFAVAFELAAGVAVLYDRGGPASAASTASGPSDAGVRSGDAAKTETAPGGILAAGQFKSRRGSGRQPTTATTTEAVTTPAAPAGATPTSTDPTVTSTTARSAPGTNGAPGMNGTNGSPGTKGANGSPGTSVSANRAQTTAVFTDPAGDTVVDGSGAGKAERAADIVQSHAIYNPKAIVFALQTDQSADPRQDPHWASESSYISWELDTNGDAKPEYEIQFSLDEGTPIAGVSRLGDADATSVCEAEAGYLTEGLTVAFDPACIDRPPAFSYRVTIYYDTDPTNEAADVVTDVAPDGGLSKPVARP